MKQGGMGDGKVVTMDYGKYAKSENGFAKFPTRFEFNYARRDQGKSGAVTESELAILESTDVNLNGPIWADRFKLQG